MNTMNQNEAYLTAVSFLAIESWHHRVARVSSGAGARFVVTLTDGTDWVLEADRNQPGVAKFHTANGPREVDIATLKVRYYDAGSGKLHYVTRFDVHCIARSAANYAALAQLPPVNGQRITVAAIAAMADYVKVWGAAHGVRFDSAEDRELVAVSVLEAGASPDYLNTGYVHS